MPQSLPQSEFSGVVIHWWGLSSSADWETPAPPHFKYLYHAFPGRQARVDCLNNVAFEQALKQNTDKDQLGEICRLELYKFDI